MDIIKDKRKEIEIKVANLIAKKIHDYLKTQSQVVLAIPGGNSVSGIFSLLKHQHIPWRRVHIFMVDERLVSLDHPDNNFRQAEKNFLEYLVKQKKISKINLHPYIYFNFPNEQGVNAYKNELKEISDNFDITLLSSGVDGHVAALFPHHSVKNSSDFFITLNDSPKPPPNRLTASRKFIQKSKTVILLFLGESKSQALKDFQNPKLSIIDCPAKLVQSVEDSHIFTDIE
ncbi:MAG: 6-phosphogluconolactonase [Nanoarchaeota archaeon]|nr:6-phosphogluconolactonase [Nanoarchaeota archaeon]